MNLYSDWFASTKSRRTVGNGPRMKKIVKARLARKEFPQFKVTVRHGNGIAPHRVLETELCWDKTKVKEIGHSACLRLAPILGVAVYWSFKYFPAIQLVSKRTTRRIRK